MLFQNSLLKYFALAPKERKNVAKMFRLVEQVKSACPGKWGIRVEIYGPLGRVDWGRNLIEPYTMKVHTVETRFSSDFAWALNKKASHQTSLCPGRLSNVIEFSPRNDVCQSLEIFFLRVNSLRCIRNNIIIIIIMWCVVYEIKNFPMDSPRYRWNEYAKKCNNTVWLIGKKLVWIFLWCRSFSVAKSISLGPSSCVCNKISNRYH